MGLRLFDKPGEVFVSKSFKILQVVADGMALAHANTGDDFYSGPVCLIINNEGKYYYDDEFVNVPKGKIVRQVGIYKYITTMEIDKTVPVVQIFDK